ncbi:MAG: AMIN domain-containing protein, partial [Candidatus Anstonellales archaeon]
MKIFANIVILFFSICICNGIETSLDESTSATTTQQQNLKQGVEVKEVVASDKSVKVICSAKPEFSKFYLDSPPRVVVDIKDSILKFEKEEVIVDSSYIKKVRIRQFKTEPQKIVRVVLDLVKKSPYKVEVDNSDIIISVLSSSMKVVQKETSESEAIKTKKTEAEATTEELTSSNIEALQVQQEQTSNQKEVQQVVTQQEKVKSSDKKQVSAKKEGILLEKKGVLPKTLVTLECVDADITDVLQMLALKANINIIYGPDVTGKITISLKNVPF